VDSFIKKTHDLDIPAKSIVTTLYKGNISSLNEMREYIFGHHIDSWILRPVIQVGRAKEYMQDDVLDLGDYKYLIQFVKENVPLGYDIRIAPDIGFLGEDDSLRNPNPGFKTVGLNNLYLLPNGDVKAMPEDIFPIEGNIRQQSLKEIWQNAFQETRSFKNPDYCLNCKYYGYCPGELLEEKYISQTCIQALKN
jgi:radical SAM protein with 4Fe4S-binding SPASM domain